MSNAIAVEGLVKRYGSLTAVDGISFTVQEGEIFGFLGPNGAGKTSTLECIEGLRRPDGGQIHVLGHNAWTQREQLRGKIGVQLEGGTSFPHLTVKENLDTLASIYTHPRSTEQLISWIGLQEQRNVVAEKLSRGQRQRLIVAMALVSDPPIVLLDEPTLGFDPQARLSFWDTLNELRNEGKTLVLSTHVMEEAEQICDRVAIVNRGKLVALDTPRALIGRFDQQTAIECEFKEDTEVSAEMLEKLPATTRVKALQQSGMFVIYTNDIVTTMIPLIEITRREAAHFKNMGVRSATLEDVFISLTGGRLRD